MPRLRHVSGKVVELPPAKAKVVFQFIQRRFRGRLVLLDLQRGGVGVNCARQWGEGRLVLPDLQCGGVGVNSALQCGGVGVSGAVILDLLRNILGGLRRRGNRGHCCVLPYMVVRRGSAAERESR